MRKEREGRRERDEGRERERGRGREGERKERQGRLNFGGTRLGPDTALVCVCMCMCVCRRILEGWV